MGLVVALVAHPAAAGWPPFLPAPDALPSGIVAAVEEVWRDPTLVRTVQGEPLAVPLELYRVFFDAPDVTAAAARHLGVARYRVSLVGDRTYEADDRDGARGVYVVLAEGPERRVLLSTGQHRGALLGTIGGRALTVVTLEERSGAVVPQLTAYVRIENALAAALARALIPLFGHIADRKLAEGFRVTAAVVDWASQAPDEFCRWLAGAEIPPARAAHVAAALGGCGLARSAPVAPASRDSRRGAAR